MLMEVMMPLALFIKSILRRRKGGLLPEVKAPAMQILRVGHVWA